MNQIHKSQTLIIIIIIIIIIDFIVEATSEQEWSRTKLVRHCIISIGYN